MRGRASRCVSLFTCYPSLNALNPLCFFSKVPQQNTPTLEMRCLHHAWLMFSDRQSTNTSAWLRCSEASTRGGCSRRRRVAMSPPACNSWQARVTR